MTTPYSVPDTGAAPDTDAAPTEFAALQNLGRAFRAAVASAAHLQQAHLPKRAAVVEPHRGIASYVINRRGERDPVRFDRITARNERLCTEGVYGPELTAIDPPLITAEVVRRFRNGMTTRELDAETADVCTSRITHHGDYEQLAVRLYVSDLHKRMPENLAEALEVLGDVVAARLTPELVAIIRRAAPLLGEQLDSSRDFRFRFFGFQTIARSYLLRAGARGGDESTLRGARLLERPQHLYMRVALGVFVCQPDGRGHEAPDELFAARLADACAFYDALSLQRVSNATPTMLNAGTIVPQLSSCFQLATGDDLTSLFDTVKSSALISKWSGGVSLWLHNIRAEGAPIRKTGGESSGIKRYVKILNEVQLYVDQGGNRPGAFAIYLSVDHDDIFTFLAMARLKGEEALKSLNAPDLKYALWVSDAFMAALEAQLAADAARAAGRPHNAAAGDWHLFSPDTAPGLHLAHGAEYAALRARYIAEGRARRVVKAGDIIAEAFKTWVQVGTPYVLFKDAINAKSNMSNVGPIASSNLCVAGNTLVLTSMGHMPIAHLVGLPVTVWNGSEWSQVAVACTSNAATLVRVTLDNGSVLDCTAYHKFYLADGTAEGLETTAAGLPTGAVLQPAPAWPVVDAVGGHLSGVNPECRIKALTHIISGAVPLPGDTEADIDCDVSKLYRRMWGNGLQLIGGRQSLLDLRFSLQCLGCDARVGPVLAPAGNPNLTEKPELAQLHVSAPLVNQLVACAEMVQQFASLGAPLPYGYDGMNTLMGGLPELSEKRIRVVSVEPLPGRHATFCFNEPKRHRGVFNGVLTGQCCEITIPSWSAHDAPDFARFHPDNAGDAAGAGEFGVCNLAAVCLESFVVDGVDGAPATFDFVGVAEAAALETRALNRVIDLSFYPSDECRRSNRRHRPIGVGIMGLADVYARLDLIFGSPEALALARAIAAAVYFGAMRASCELAAAEGAYASFPGSPTSRGLLQPDLWVAAGDLPSRAQAGDQNWEEEIERTTQGFLRPSDWASLRNAAVRGVRNAYVTAYMPTATTSNIVGQNECFEPFTSNMYTRKTLAGEFLVVNRHLMRRLAALGLWDEEMRQALLAAGGSVQSIARIPEPVRRLHRTARETHPSLIVRTAAAMAPFVCQSMSMNLFLDEPDLPKILRFLLEGWRAGLKTGMYYCHMKPATGAQKAAAPAPTAPPTRVTCTEEVCTSCAL